MVTTRAQAKRERSSGSDNDVHELSSGEDANTPRRGSESGRGSGTIHTTPINNNATPAAAVATTNTSNGEGEKLGRGCRVSRSSVSLDEQYLAVSLYRSNAHHRSYAGQDHREVPTRSSHAAQPPQREEAFAINRRYPMREAAKRAMENLHVTLTSANGAAALNADSTDDNSNSMGTFHFRNHPELVELIEKKQQRQQQRKHRHRRRHGGSVTSSSSSNGSDSDSDSSDSDGDPSSSSSITSGSRNGENNLLSSMQSPKPSAAAPMYGGSNAYHSSSSSPLASSSGGGGLGVRNGRGRPALSLLGDSGNGARAGTRRIAGGRNNHNNNTDALSLDSSITEVSMREESVERQELLDRHAHPQSSSAASSDNEDGTRDFADEAERRRAQRHARDSVNDNRNINSYMLDAVGVADARRIRRRQLDRRYRWLVYQGEEARARGDWSGVGSVGIGGVGGDGGDGSAVTTANGALGDILPLRVDDDVTFDSVGGLPEHIVALREMVLLPLLYPDVFQRLDLKAPRGVLFVGPPGTGKTLMARALANEGMRFGGGGGGDAAPSSSSSATPSPGRHAATQRITFFLRKGADLLSKWVGESERQLKLLFEEAKRLQPSIIFFDEVDGLAPTRHAKTEQTQAALVSTLLALLDGLQDRGQVVVIGATNRPDTLDPALRRPGRLDRELVFPLPDAAARRHILTIQLAKKAMPESAEQRAALLNDLVEMTEGYSGADLGALCTEASLHRLRTALPQLYLSRTRLLVPRAVEQAQLHVRAEDFYAAAQLMQPSLRRCRSARPAEAGAFLDPYVEVLVRGTRDATLAALAPSWSLVDRVLRASSRDCQDMTTAVRMLCAVPIPQPPRPCLLVLHEAVTSQAVPAASTLNGQKLPPPPQQQQKQQQQQQQHRRALQLHHLSISLMKGLSGLQQLTVNLPELVWEGETTRSTAWSFSQGGLSAYGGGRGGGDYSKATVDDYLGGGGGNSGGAATTFTHMSEVVQSVQQCSPCVVYLSGAEEWVNAPPSNSDEDETDEENDEESAQKAKDSIKSNATATCGERHSRRRQQRRAQLFRHYMNMLADTDVVFLLPCASAATCALLLGASPTLSSSASESSPPSVFPDASWLTGQGVASSELFSLASLSSPPLSPTLIVDQPSAVHLARMPVHCQLLHPQFSIVHASIATTPLLADLRRFVEYMHRIVTMTLRLHHGEDEEDTHQGGNCDGDGTHGEANADSTSTRPAPMAEDNNGQGDLAHLRLREDDAPLPSPFTAAQQRARYRADRVRRCNLWRKVEYRRLQLRHVLMKWVSQYINSAKFKLLASADLDLAPDDPLFKAWRRHTKDTRIGLQDILEKIEDERYVCLSQYNDDVDQLVRNVRSFFRTRAPQDQRYRLKALDLKETCLLNMYKVNREVIRFCEETRTVQEPSSSDSDEDGIWRENRTPWEKELSTGQAAAVVTSLVRKEDDPALIAEQSRRAVSFSQRPAAPARKRRRTGWRFGDSRPRRRKRTAVGRQAQQQQQPEEVKEGEKEDAPSSAGSVTTKEVREDGSQAGSTCEGKSDGDDNDEEEARRVASTAVASANNDSSVEGWACALLSSYTYTRLYHVFKSVMRGLEVEVRTLEDQLAHKQRPQKEQPQQSLSSIETTRESYVTCVFKKLLVAAVEELNG